MASAERPSVDITVPQGFEFAAVACGIKASGNPDIALAVCREGASAAAVFTTNRVVAAPVVVGRKNLKATRGRLKAVLVNSGNANCATGTQGLKVSEQSCKELAVRLGIKASEVIPCSTGVIGVQMPSEKLFAGISAATSQVSGSKDAALCFGRAIMTTDTRMKIATAKFKVGSKEATILGMCKGAGMIHPQMATMLAYVFSDVEAAPRQLQSMLKATADRTFNRISIDGDTSTNDTLLLMASGASKVKLGTSSIDRKFSEALQSVCASLSEQIVRDGEGVQHVIRLHIEGAKSEREADRIAQVIATSPLVKTAWAGADPNWGRILAAIGRSGVDVDPMKVEIALGDQVLCRKGVVGNFDEDRAHQHLSQPDVSIRVNLGRGRSRILYLTCDLSAEYVRINADYRT